MASGIEFITKMASYYASNLRSGLPYDIAYDHALKSSAADYNFVCAPNTQDLKLMILINPYGCVGRSSDGSTGNSVSLGPDGRPVLQDPLIPDLMTTNLTPFLDIPNELKNLSLIQGAEGANATLTEMFSSCLDGTMQNAGFDEVAIGSLLTKLINYIKDGCLTVRLLCSCSDDANDPCKVVTSITLDKNIRYGLPDPKDQLIRDRIEATLASDGVVLDLDSLSLADLQQLENSFIESLNILYNQGKLAIDPNSQQAAAIISDFFGQFETILEDLEAIGPAEFARTNINGSDFVMLLSILNKSGPFVRMTSMYKRMANSLARTLERIGAVSVNNNMFRVDYQNNSVLFSSVMELDSKAAGCDPSKYPINSFPSPVQSKIKIGCECPPKEEETCKISFLANTVARPMIYEVPYFFASGKVNAELPTAPDVQFIPIKDVDNRILINLNTMAGRYTTKFISITTSDTSYINLLASSRGLQADELFDFEGDPTVLYYEAFRIEFHPRTYTDFANGTKFIFKNYKEGFTTFRNNSYIRDFERETYSNAMSEEHYLTPNKPYYYIFRTVDINKNISNPSRIFQIQMINDGGAIFPYIRIVDFDVPQLVTDKVDMRRMLMLSLQFEQTNIASVATELIEEEGVKTARDALRNLRLSNSIENPVWGKKFKIRFTSSDTGKMLDLNVTPTATIEDPEDGCPTTRVV
jgi:hypothetical protein